MKQLPDAGKIDSKEAISCLDWTKYKGGRKLSENF